MATGKGSRKGNTPRGGSNLPAAGILSEAATRLYALANIGEQTCNMHIFTARYAIKGLCDSARAIFAQTELKLPAQHAARKHLRNAGAALDSLDAFMEALDAVADVPQGREFHAMAGAVIRSFVGTCGRYMERAELEMGAIPSTGYLQGELLEGGDMERTAPDERRLVLAYRNASPEGKRLMMLGGEGG